MWAIVSGVLLLLCIGLCSLLWRLRLKLQMNETILSMSLQLSSTVERRQLLALIMEKTTTALGAEGSSIILMDHESGDLYFEVATGNSAEEVKKIRLPAGEGIAGWVQIHGKSVLIPDVSQDFRWSNKVQNETEVVTRNMLCAPIFSNGTLLGVIQVINKKNNGRFKAYELDLLEQLSAPIAMSLENMMLYEALRHSMDSLQQTTAAKEKMLSEMRMASQIQLSLLPGEQFQHGNLSLNAKLLPAREVGGDFYHFFELDEEHVVVCLGDVSDKGMPAALFMSSLMIWIRAKAQKGMNVSEMVYSINNEISSEDSTMFATLFIAIINTRTRLMQYCDAGHCPVLLLQNGQVATLDVHKGLPIGVMPHMRYEAMEMQLAANTTVVIYSDGITEAESELGHMYGPDRLEQYIRSRQRSLQAQAVIEDVQQFAEGFPQSDDIAVLVFTMT
ncbi:PP2C family protein-serine/threonine phosphatase [Paenibacillus septentrionalis]|uniref:PP2C family protein-serine/threonine phosphatase n=1 Tax=Paenibacillus septentrionalis TaxID=429342 RepID=A0ABW1V6K9_9BACL